MAEQNIHDMNVSNQIALDTLKRLSLAAVGGLRSANQPPSAVVPNTYALRPQESQQSAVLPRGQGSSIVPAATNPSAVTPEAANVPKQITQQEHQPATPINGSRPTLITQGTHGQEGYGRIVVTQPVTGLRTAAPLSVDYNSQMWKDYEAQNRLKANPFDPQVGGIRQVSDVPTIMAAHPVFGGTGGWKTDLAKYQADTQAYNAAMNEQGGIVRESLRAIAGQQPVQESQSQVNLRTAQTDEAKARTGLLDTQAKTTAEQQKWVTLTEEVPTFDPASGTTIMKKQQYLYNPASKEIARPGEAAGAGSAQDAAAKRAAFAATYITKDLQKKWESMSDSEKDAAMDVITKAAAKK